jgi:broad specificity phosphatase PhoE
MTGNAPTTVLVARHGRSVANEARTVAGQLDVPLSPEGHRQANALSLLLSDRALDAVYASSLRRAIATAQPTASQHGIDVRQVAAFNELHFGSLEGRNRDTDEAVRVVYERWRADPECVALPGGESFADLTKRIGPKLADLISIHEGETILIVGHQVTNRVILRALTNGSTLGINIDVVKAKLRSRNVYEICTGQHPSIRTITIRGGCLSTIREGFHE